jgi:aminopeptidase C
MMKSGKLRRVMVSDNVRLLSSDVEQISSKQFEALTPSVCHVSDNTIESLQRQLSDKDAIIAELLARQREMSVMMERLQEQLYELTRYVLSQAKQPPERGFQWAFWRRSDKRHNTTEDPS